MSQLELLPKFVTEKLDFLEIISSIKTLSIEKLSLKWSNETD